MNIEEEAVHSQNFQHIEPKSSNQIDHPVQEQEKVKIAPQTNQSICPIYISYYLKRFYQPYFNIDQRDIKMRLRCAFFPRKPEFFQLIGKNPDLWSPIWITSTLVFLLFAAGNFSNYLSSNDKDNFQYEYAFVPTAMATVYGMGFVLPILLVGLLRILGADTLVFDTICLYGYSMACFVPILLLCVIPFDIAQWIFLVYGIIASTVFLIVNLWDEFKKVGGNKQFIPIVIIVAFQVVLLLMFKLYFFHLIYNSD